jgi:D-tyrosyl-tRNA(Tyr) deacylase
MRAVVQRVSSAAVDVEGRRVAEIERGLLVFIGVTHDDGDAEMRQIASKLANLRILSDDAGKMNLSVLDLGLPIIIVSQFTLYADARKGRRPSFIAAAAPEQAAPLIERLCDELRSASLHVQTGVFGAEMAISLVNDGPVTIWLDTAEL